MRKSSEHKRTCRKLKSIRGLVSYIAFKEENKVEAPVGDIKRIVAILSDLCLEYPNVIKLLYENGLKRAQK